MNIEWSSMLKATCSFKVVRKQVFFLLSGRSLQLSLCCGCLCYCFEFSLFFFTFVLELYCLLPTLPCTTVVEPGGVHCMLAALMCVEAS